MKIAKIHIPGLYELLDSQKTLIYYISRFVLGTLQKR